jgi:di/tricarboxylate transporter
MTVDNVLVLGILLGALVLFVSERFRVDVVALIVLSALILTGLVSVEEAFSGFASPAVVTVWSVFIISGAVNRSGIADALGRFMLRLAGTSPLRLTVTVMLTVGVMSAFMNNIGAVAILLPAVVTVARDVKLPSSKLLIPLSFASLLGGNMTLIGTPPNILASSLLESYGGIEPFTFFDFLPTGLMVLGAGTLYMALVGRHILPARTPSSDPSRAVDLRPFLSEVRIAENSQLVGRTAVAYPFGDRYDLNIIQVRRGDAETFFPSPDRQLAAGDVLLVEGRPEDMLTVSMAYQLVPAPGERATEIEQELTSDSGRLVEITLAPNAEVAGKSLKELDFRNKFGLTVMALRHQGESIVTRLADVPLSVGDAMLVQGSENRIELLRRDDDYLVLDTPPLQTRRLRKAPVTVAILLGVLLVVTLGWLPVAAAMLIGALLLVLSGALTMDEAYQSIEWRSIFLIAGMLPLGIAMETTGTAALLANQIIGLFGDLGPRAVLMGVFVMTALLTEIISNAAATVLVVPIAIDAALGLDASPRAFVMAAVIAASTSFLMPIGHQVNVLVFGPGGYRFSDYTRVGVWLNLIIATLVALFLPLIWPLFP